MSTYVQPYIVPIPKISLFSIVYGCRHCTPKMSTYVQPHIVPVCLPTSSRLHFAGKKAWVTGWGKVHDGYTHHFQPNSNQDSIPVIWILIMVPLIIFNQLVKFKSKFNSFLLFQNFDDGNTHHFQPNSNQDFIPSCYFRIFMMI